MKRLIVIRTPHLGIHAAILTRSRDFTACGLQVSDGERKVARAETVDCDLCQEQMRFVRFQHDSARLTGLR